MEKAIRQGVIAVIRRNGCFLVIRRGLTLARAPGKYCFPGGTIEPDEASNVALRRELREELGIEVQPVQPIWNSVTAWGVQLEWWDSICNPDAVFKPCPIEVDWYGWMSVDELRSLPDLLPGNIEFLDLYTQGRLAIRPNNP